MINKFSHAKRADGVYKDDGLRPFFRYRDLGIADATGGRILMQLVRAADLPRGGTGLHYHVLDWHIVYMVAGWATFIYDGVETLVDTGDCVYQNPGLVHNLIDWSTDMEFMEIISPIDFGTVPVIDVKKLLPD